jgi:carbon-monoxide dehydrogenase medium subunit
VVSVVKSLGVFSYVAPEGVPEVLKVLKQSQGRCRVLAGGTDLFVMMRKGVLTPELLVDVRRAGDDLKSIRALADGLHIGAACTIADLEGSPVVREHAPLLKKAIAQFANMQVRNRATVGGNICRSSPAGDTLPALLVMDASVRLVRTTGDRLVPLADFFTGPGMNSMDGDELLTEVIIPPAPGGRLGEGFHKVMRSAEDLSKISVAVRLIIEGDVIADAAVAVGAVAPVPKRLPAVEAALKGAKATVETLLSACASTASDIAPISDVRSTKDYRLRTTPIFVRRTLEAALEEANL